MVLWEKRLRRFASSMQAKNVPVMLRLWNGSEIKLGNSPRVTISTSSLAGLRHLLSPSLDRLGYAYVEGELDVDGHVMDIIDVAARLSSLAHGDKPSRSVLRLARHSRKQDADDITYHYDVSNDFYALWLDRNMVYSCAYFQNEHDSLDTAQEQKMDHIFRKLRLRPGERLLDIGCGWGALVMRAAEKFGVEAVGITLSQNQCELANERIRQRGLQDRCEVRIEDYRDVSGHFDRIASVGMFEHVGLKNLRGYFEKVDHLLAPDGAALIHGITSTDPDSAETPWGGGEFIDRYVFPNGELPHIGLVLKEMAAAGLEAMDVESLRRHYAMTLGHWAERFDAAGDKIRQLVDERTYRIWRVYLAGCAYGFQQNWISVHQILVTHGRGIQAMPLTRDDMYAY
ncbi:MAG TPA: class I SAM-dependent methyltransferase [Mariprofundaceae bacterium]|nr:class I SAM-dependent methyltransferase [Mariprofundaceae bacterium]